MSVEDLRRAQKINSDSLRIVHRTVRERQSRIESLIESDQKGSTVHKKEEDDKWISKEQYEKAIDSLNEATGHLTVLRREHDLLQKRHDEFEERVAQPQQKKIDEPKKKTTRRTYKIKKPYVESLSTAGFDDDDAQGKLPAFH
jgi:hypothetical protein